MATAINLITVIANKVRAFIEPPGAVTHSSDKQTDALLACFGGNKEVLKNNDDKSQNLPPSSRSQLETGQKVQRGKELPVKKFRLKNSTNQNNESLYFHLFYDMLDPRSIYSLLCSSTCSTFRFCLKNFDKTIHGFRFLS